MKTDIPDDFVYFRHIWSFRGQLEYFAVVTNYSESCPTFYCVNDEDGGVRHTFQTPTCPLFMPLFFNHSVILLGADVAPPFLFSFSRCLCFCHHDSDDLAKSTIRARQSKRKYTPRRLHRYLERAGEM